MKDTHRKVCSSIKKKLAKFSLEKHEFLDEYKKNMLGLCAIYKRMIKYVRTCGIFFVMCRNFNTCGCMKDSFAMIKIVQTHSSHP